MMVDRGYRKRSKIDETMPSFVSFKIKKKYFSFILYSERCSYKILEERIYFDCNVWEENSY